MCVCTCERDRELLCVQMSVPGVCGCVPAPALLFPFLEGK